MANEIVKKDENTAVAYGTGANLGELFAEELDGLTPSFERRSSRKHDVSIIITPAIAAI